MNDEFETEHYLLIKMKHFQSQHCFLHDHFAKQWCSSIQMSAHFDIETSHLNVNLCTCSLLFYSIQTNLLIFMHSHTKSQSLSRIDFHFNTSGYRLYKSISSVSNICWMKFSSQSSIWNGFVRNLCVFHSYWFICIHWTVRHFTD